MLGCKRNDASAMAVDEGIIEHVERAHATFWTAVSKARSTCSALPTSNDCSSIRSFRAAAVVSSRKTEFARLPGLAGPPRAGDRARFPCQQFQPFGTHLRREEAKAGETAPGPGQARDEPGAEGIGNGDKHHRGRAATGLHRHIGRGGGSNHHIDLKYASRSATRPGSRSYRPSAQRGSTMMFCPST